MGPFPSVLFQRTLSHITLPLFLPLALVYSDPGLTLEQEAALPPAEVELDYETLKQNEAILSDAMTSTLPDDDDEEFN